MAIYTASVAPTNATLAQYKAWAQFFGGGFTTIGWTAQTGHGEVVASGTGGSYAWTNVATVGTTALTTVLGYTFKGAWVSGTTYVGGNTTNSSVCDVVTDGGLTYVHITSTSSLATAPGSDATNWQPFNFEIWKSTGAMSSSLPIYVKLVYTTAGSNGFRIMLSIGTGVDANGNLTGVVPSTGTAPVGVALIDNGTTTSVSTGEMDFSGDTDNFRFCTWRDGPSIGYVNIVVIDRAKTATGTDSDSFFYFGRIFSQASSTSGGSAIKLNTSLGGGVIQTNMSSSTGGWAGVVHDGSSSSIAPSSLNFGSVTPLPIFPLVGYVANPLLGCVGFPCDMVVNGAINAVWLYGASHNYLACRLTTAGGLSINAVTTHGIIPAILWE